MVMEKLFYCSVLYRISTLVSLLLITEKFKYKYKDALESWISIQWVRVVFSSRADGELRFVGRRPKTRAAKLFARVTF